MQDSSKYLYGIFLGLLLGTLAMSQAAPAADCPLQGTWTAGFSSRKAAQFAKIALTFDCAGRAEMEATLLGGRMFTGTGTVYKRMGRYTVRGPSQEVPGGFNVDVVIDSYSATYLDANTVLGQRTDNDRCGDEHSQLLEPENRLGRNCDGTRFPDRGFVERAVFKIDGTTLYWSPFTGPNQVVIQPPNDPPRRKGAVDMNRPFTKTL